MGKISVELNAVSGAIKKCQTIQAGLKCESTKMLHQYYSLGNGWNDEKYRELGQIVHKCSDALKQPLSELQRCEAFLQQLYKIISDYENIHFYGEGSESTSTNEFQTHLGQATSAILNAGIVGVIGLRFYQAINGENPPPIDNVQSWFNGANSVASFVDRTEFAQRIETRCSIRRYNRMSEAASRNVDYQHERSLRNYCLDGYQDMNGYLRGTTTREFSTEYASIVQDDINNLTETLNDHQLGRNMTLYRGVSNPRHIIGDNWQNMSIEEINNANVGRVFHDDGFCSTSVDPNGAADFSQSWTGATMIIQAPADANGMCVGTYNNRTAEREVLLQRGSNFRIDGVSRDHYGNCVIRATLIGRGG